MEINPLSVASNTQFLKNKFGSSTVAQQVKDLALSLQWLWLLQWHEFDYWPRNFCLTQANPCIHTHTQKDCDLAHNFGSIISSMERTLESGNRNVLKTKSLPHPKMPHTESHPAPGTQVSLRAKQDG